MASLQSDRAIALDPPRLSASNDGSWLVKVLTNYSDDTMSDRFRALTAEHGGEYDGGGTFVGYVPVDELPGELRPPGGHLYPSW